MTIARILVQLADHPWTLEATHRACQIARSTQAEIIFLKMIRVQHIGWLGTELGYMGFTEDDYRALQSYAATAEDYGVACSIQRYQYISFIDGLGDVAEMFQTQLVFATPSSSIALLQRFQAWALRRRLARKQYQLADEQVIASLLADADKSHSPLPDVYLSL